ncbi:MAG: DUF4197 domain-containing protein [Bacteroidales bacterium]|nr:DUF4197 domain-containing protein [Bacteroidales bacterium]
MNRKLVFLAFITLALTSCSELQQIANQMITTNSTLSPTNENASGLKEALSVGIANTVTALNKQNGYYSNQALKIFLPNDAKMIVDNIKYVPGGEKMLNDVVLRLNRAAEDAAVEAKPIFVNAIRNMTIADATGILFGNKNAATTYLKQNTYSQLTAAFQPKIAASLDKKLIGNISTTQSWSTLTTAYNKVANSIIGQTASLKPVNSNLSGYVTERALDGMFLSLANEEKQIRDNPSARVNALLKKVFGQLDKK